MGYLAPSPGLEECLGFLRDRLARQLVIPYLGPEVFHDGTAVSPMPRNPNELAAALAARVPVPGRIRSNLSAAAQYIESKRHRKTLEGALNSLFSAAAPVTATHRWIASLPQPLPLIVDTWYDDALPRLLAERLPGRWGMIAGISHPQSNGQWVNLFTDRGEPAAASAPASWDTVLYKPFGAVWPQGNYLISDSDLVEVLTEIDIQSPIPPVVLDRRVGRHFLFLGCRFDGELSRTFARQISKRSADRHWAVIEGGLSRNEERFLDQYSIERLDLPLDEALRRLAIDAPGV